MLRRKLSSIIVVALMTNMTATPLTAFAETINTNKAIEEATETEEVKQAQVSKFEQYYSNYKEQYDSVFKMDNSNIESIEVNGNHRNSSVKENMLDGNLNTYWETAKVNTSTFTNEIVFNLNQETELNRIAYRSAGNTVGFAEEFEIWGTTEENPDEFKLVSTGSTTKTANVIEIKFEKTNFKKIKFVFKKSYNNTATVSEIMFYKEDTVLDKMKSIFTDSTLSVVNEEFNTPEKFNALEEVAKQHPLYEEYKETINNAKALVNKEEVIFTETIVNSFGVSDNKLEEYNQQFKISRDEIINASNTGGTSNRTVIGNVLDGDLNSGNQER